VRTNHHEPTMHYHLLMPRRSCQIQASFTRVLRQLVRRRYHPTLVNKRVQHSFPSLFHLCYPSTPPPPPPPPLLLLTPGKIMLLLSLRLQSLIQLQQYSDNHHHHPPRRRRPILNRIIIININFWQVVYLILRLLRCHLVVEIISIFSCRTSCVKKC